MRCKFKLDAIERSMGSKCITENGEKKWVPAEQQTLKFSPVYGNGDPDHENTKFWQATPSGSFVVSCVNADAVAGLDIGKEYYLDITPA